MPNKRILWFKMWIGSTRHEKVAQLDDRTFRAWVELLDGAAQQTVRGRYASVRAAAAVIRRPVGVINRLVAVGLIDERDDGIWMHDWQDWQRWRPEDASNDDPSPTDHPPINTRSPGDQHTMTNGTTHEYPSRAAERAKRGDGRVETGDGERDTPPPPSGAPPQLRVVGEPIPKPTPRPTPVGTLLDKIKSLDCDLEVYGDQGFTGRKLKENPQVDLDLVAEAYVSYRHGEWPGSKMLRESGALAWVIGDLGGYVTWRENQAGSKRPAAPVDSEFSRGRLLGEAG